MTPHKKVNWTPWFDRPQVFIRPAPYQVQTGNIITMHYDRVGAENEVRWQREQYGRTAVIVEVSA